MKSRWLSLGVAVWGTLLTFPGCDWPHQGVRRRGQEPGLAHEGDDDVESTKILDVQSDPLKPKPFFRSSRLSGGLSDEAREIESHVGIR